MIKGKVADIVCEILAKKGAKFFGFLRSANDNRTLSSIRINTFAGEKGFIYAGPKSWNKLPYCICHAVSLEILRNI